MMKKPFNFLLMGALVCGLSLSVTSCKDDDDNNDNSEESMTTLTFDSDLLKHGVETDMQSAVIEVPIKADGLWTATLRTAKGGYDIPDWCRILDWHVSYDGNQTLEIAIDENLTKVGRTCYLVLGNNGDQYTPITVYQNTTYKGDDLGNGSGQAFADLGMGTGIYYDYLLNMKNKENETREFNPTLIHGSNNIFNMTRIQALKASGKLQKSAYVEAPIELDNLKASLLDSCVSQSKRCSVSVELGVEFGVLSFSGKGRYNSRKDEDKAHVDYTIVRQAPMYNVYLSPAELTAYSARNRRMDRETQDLLEEEIEDMMERYHKKNQRNIDRGKLSPKDLDKDGLTEEQAAEIDCMYDNSPIEYDFAGIFSMAFASHYNKLYNAITRRKTKGKPIDTETADYVLKVIDTQYGPFYIDGGNFGGLMVVHARVDTMSLRGLSQFGGTANLEALGGAIKLDASFSYTEDGYNAWHYIQPEFHIYGGNAKDTSTQLLSIIASGNPNDMNKWQGVLLNWINSMESPDSDMPGTNLSKASPISFIVQPIWQLFNEPDIQVYARDFFLNEYRDRGIEAWEQLCIGGVNPKADDLLDVNSDFWKTYGKIK